MRACVRACVRVCVCACVSEAGARPGRGGTSRRGGPTGPDLLDALKVLRPQDPVHLNVDARGHACHGLPACSLLLGLGGLGLKQPLLQVGYAAAQQRSGRRWSGRQAGSMVRGWGNKGQAATKVSGEVMGG